MKGTIAFLLFLLVASCSPAYASPDTFYGRVLLADGQRVTVALANIKFCGPRENGWNVAYVFKHKRTRAGWILSEIDSGCWRGLGSNIHLRLGGAGYLIRATAFSTRYPGPLL